MAKRIDTLTDAQKGRFKEWADKWIAIGLCTDPADRPMFEAAAEACYGFAKIPWPGEVIWVRNPLEGAILNGTKLAQLKNPKATEADIRASIRQHALACIGGQFWGGGWYYGGAWTSFFREVCDLELPGDLWDRGRAYEATMQSACWWWPTTHYVIACERPSRIVRERVGPDGWGSHRLHCEDGPAVAWEGWSIYAWHGVRVPEQVILAPETLTAEQITSEPNQEVRRAMIERTGWDRYLDMTGAAPVQQDQYGAHYRVRLNEDMPAFGLTLVTDSTPEMDGTRKRYGLKTDVQQTAHAAVASTFGLTEREYAPARET